MKSVREKIKLVKEKIKSDKEKIKSDKEKMKLVPDVPMIPDDPNNCYPQSFPNFLLFPIQFH